ncbi:transketolase [Jonesiaceae bacterium BS-20]|uniref:transketolase n=1 Tax=Jonesiaceae bacterium BS-20 TaxID=3120821 RepID=A0AAU7DQH7_9MICO
MSTQVATAPSTPLNCSTVENQSINTSRMLAVDQVFRAGSGHYGFPLGAGSIVHTLFAKHLMFNPGDPTWINRDRFILSAGHGSAMLYSMLHLAGYDLSISDLKDFRQWGSKTPGHPERDDTPGVEVTTGPLGQGFANAVGIAIAEEYLRSLAGSDTINHRTWVLVSDGDLMEGIAYEAAAIAGKLELGKLCVIYDDNDVVIDSRASETMDSEGIVGMFRALDWEVLEVTDGMDIQALDLAMVQASQQVNRPTMIRVKTVIGAGSPLSDNKSSHSGAPSQQDLEATRAALELQEFKPFEVPEPVADYWIQVRARLQQNYDRWQRKAKTSPGKQVLDSLAQAGTTALAALAQLPLPSSNEATRTSSGTILDAIYKDVPFLIGGAADLAGATFARFTDSAVFGSETRSGQNIRFGVREHAMTAIANGITLHSELRGFGSTFLMFATYAANSLRMAALQSCGSIHVFSHDSVLLGEDGPTHQPVEVLSFLRSIPKMQVLRPADFYETKEAWALAITEAQRPTCIVLSRSVLPQLDRTSQIGSASQGAFLLKVVDNPEVVLIASGSETHLALEAAERMSDHRIAVVSVLDTERFASLPSSEFQKFAPEGTPRVIIEASHPMSWYRILRPSDRFVGVSEFGASAPEQVIAQEFGLTSENICKVATEVITSFATSMVE